jgi:hypothetical protein
MLGERLDLDATGSYDGNALGCDILLEGIIVAVFLLLHPDFFGGNPRSHLGSGEGDAIVSLSY